MPNKRYPSEFMLCMLSGVRVTAADTIMIVKSCLKANTVTRNDLLSLYEILENARMLLNMVEREMTRIDDAEKETLNDAEGATDPPVAPDDSADEQVISPTES